MRLSGWKGKVGQVSVIIVKWLLVDKLIMYERVLSTYFKLAYCYFSDFQTFSDKN